MSEENQFTFNHTHRNMSPPSLNQTKVNKEVPSLRATIESTFHAGQTRNNKFNTLLLLHGQPLHFSSDFLPKLAHDITVKTKQL